MCSLLASIGIQARVGLEGRVTTEAREGENNLGGKRCRRQRCCVGRYAGRHLRTLVLPRVRAVPPLPYTCAAGPTHGPCLNLRRPSAAEALSHPFFTAASDGASSTASSMLASATRSIQAALASPREMLDDAIMVSTLWAAGGAACECPTIASPIPAEAVSYQALRVRGNLCSTET